MAQQTTGTPTGPDGSAGAGSGVLKTSQGRTSIADSVVEKIAGVAAREVSGVHSMGRGASRAFGTIKEKLPMGSSGPNVSQGVKVEVGERQAAVDIDLVVDYGVSIPDLAEGVRDNVVERVERMTGLEVTEVNVTVDDIWLGDEQEDSEQARVQ
jgi:uncharacterized alkaline shock family protein YloU